MSGHQTATLEDTVYFWFAANDTSGSGGDGATPLFDVREAGALASAIPLLSGTPDLLSHANYPAGCHEIAVAATAANGFAANDTFAVFCTLAIDSQNPSGFVGSCTLTALAKAAALATVDTEVGVIDGIVDAILLDTAEIGAAGAGLTALATAAALATVDSEVGVIDGIVDAILLDTAEIGAAGAGLTALATAAALATVDTEVGVIDGVVDAILLDTAEIGAAGAGLTALATAAALATVDTEVGTIDTVVDAIKAVTDVLPDSGALTTIDGNVDAIKVITDALTSAAATKLAASMLGVVTGTASSGDTDTVVTDITGHGNDTFNGRLMVMTSGTLRYEAGIITDYVSATGTFEFAASTFTTSPTTETCIIL